MKDKRITMGIVAHVDAGKTTLSEAILYNSGKIRRLGRVDHRDSFLDTNNIERERGITVFSKQAVFTNCSSVITLLDTPGHADFGAEAERTLQVLDYAVLVVSATDGVQSHTRTLWKLLENYGVPTFIFVNKTDLPCPNRAEIIMKLQDTLSEGCSDFTDEFTEERLEAMAMCDEAIMNELLSGSVTDVTVANAISQRHIFPVFFGSALKNDGVEYFMQSFDKYTIAKEYKEDFGAKVFKISEDEQGARLTHMKITSGTLNVKTVLTGSTDGNAWSEKINEIRIYSGEKFEGVQSAGQGTICAVTGLSLSYPGEGLGTEPDSKNPMLEPVFSYMVNLPEGVSHSTAFAAFRKLSEEETKLNVSWNEQLGKITLQLMGEVQTEVLRRVIKERFGFEAEFEQGGIIYKETIANTVEGVGHYEPLRHYAEVHLILKPGKRGSGVTFSSKCREDELDLNWQRLILTHLAEKTHIGVLTGSPITDIDISLASGRAHQKHTDGGDFRQATYRAVRHGLRNAESILLEPWYDFRIEVPTENIGRVMNDISQMGGAFTSPETDGEMSYIQGSAPVAKLQSYQGDILAFTRGRGQMSCTLKGYEPCENPDEIVEKIGYNCDADVENTADSIFCSHGAAININWAEVYEHMHLESALKVKEAEPELIQSRERKFDALSVSDDELSRIFERTFGKPKEKPQVVRHRTGGDSTKSYKGKGKPINIKDEYILVDGYNIIFAWEDLKELARENIDLARNTLINRLINYKAVKGCELAVVFDAYKVKGNPGEVEHINGISVVYTKEAETADSYIEKASHTLASKYLVRVATSDNLEQMIIMGAGALRVSAPQFEKEVKAVEEAIREYLETK